MDRNRSGMQDEAPGTVLLTEVSTNWNLRDGEIGNLILHPQPSQDPNDPLNWSKPRKYLNFSISAFYAMVVFAILDIGPVVWQEYEDELGFTVEQLDDANASMLAGLAMGCLFFIRFALKFGRRPVYIITTLICFLTTVGQATLTTYRNLIACQVLSGLAVALSETLVQLSVADIFFVHERGTMNSIYLMFLNTGGFAAPVAAGFIADSMGWRWIWWWSAIFLGINLLAFIFLYEDTKYTISIEGSSPSISAEPTLFQTNQIVADGEKQVEPSSLVRSVTAGIDPSISHKSYRQRMALWTSGEGDWATFSRHFYQPLVILVTFPAVSYTALQYGAALAWYSVVSVSRSTYFPEPPYNFNTRDIGLLNLPPFIGCVLATLISGVLSDWSIRYFARRNTGVYEPEMRLYVIIIPTVLVPVGLLMYGFTLAEGAPWILPCIGQAIFALGNASIYGITLTYLVDCYREIAGDALVGIAFIRNGFSAGITYAIAPWIASIGMHNTWTSVGCISLTVALFCVPMMIWGKGMRVWRAEKYRIYASRQFSVRHNI